MVLRGRTHHRRTADVDILDDLVTAGAARDHVADDLHRFHVLPGFEVALACGATVAPVAIDEHDAAVAHISHLPHVLAAVLALLSLLYLRATRRWSED